MESLGEKLKTAREARGLNFDQISRETNISSRYLEALEREDFTSFPGEPYVQGFLKSYGEYLGLNSDELMSLYRSFKLQEQPVPVEQLLKNPSPAPKIIAVILVIVGIAGLAAGAWRFFSRIPRIPAAAPSPVARGASEYTLSTDFLERRFYPGDSILVSGGANSYKLTLTSLSDAITITTPRGPVMLDLGQEVTLDFDDDRLSELRIIAEDFAKNDSTAGALLRFEQIIRPQAAGDPQTGISPEPLISEREAVSVIYPAAGTAPSASAYPFTLQAVFQGYCLFRYEILFERDRPGRNEQYYQRSEEINVSAQNGIRLGISNAQAVKLQAIIGGRIYPFETGAAGEVVAADIRWIRDDENRYRLALIRLE